MPCPPIHAPRAGLYQRCARARQHGDHHDTCDRRSPIGQCTDATRRPEDIASNPTAGWCPWGIRSVRHAKSSLPSHGAKPRPVRDPRGLRLIHLEACVAVISRPARTIAIAAAAGLVVAALCGQLPSAAAATGPVAAGFAALPGSVAPDADPVTGTYSSSGMS